MIRVGLVGYGKAGKAVAKVLHDDPRFTLRWVARRTGMAAPQQVEDTAVPLVSLDEACTDSWLDQHTVDAIVDFSNPEAVWRYGEQVRRRRLMLVTAVSTQSDELLRHLRQLARHTRVLASPNITLGINYLIMAAKLLRGIAPFADVAVVEQHFRDKAEISGTARKIAQHLDLDEAEITSLRLGGIVGHHEVIFGFPYQTVRIVHDSIKREAFGTGVAFALSELAQCAPGFYTYEDLLMQKVRAQLLAA